MKKPVLGVGEDWLAVIVALGVILLVLIGVMPDLPWPLFGWFK